MRVLHTVAPAAFGGLEEVVVRLSAGLRSAGHDVHVAPVFSGPEREHGFVEALSSMSVEAHPLFIPPRRYDQELGAVRDLAVRLGSQILHTHGYRPDVLHPWAVHHHSIPVVTTLHGFTGGGLRNRLYQELQIQSSRRCAAVIAVSRPIGDLVAQSGVPPERVHVIPNAWSVRTELLPGTRARELLGVPPGVFHIGWVGRLSHEKGPDVLIEALRGLSDADIHVSVIGDGGLRPKLEATVAEASLPSITFHGAVRDAGQLFRAFDVLVLSSRTEGTPIVLLEAMEASVPIIATAVGGVPDVVDEASAWLVSSENPRGLRGALRKVMAGPSEARARARRARERLYDQFALRPWIAQHEHLYRSLITSSSEGATR